MKRSSFAIIVIYNTHHILHLTMSIRNDNLEVSDELSLAIASRFRENFQLPGLQKTGNF